MEDLKKHLEVISHIKSKLAGSHSKMIYLTISGSHLYGFPSKDSDIDYRGCFIANTNEILGLKTPKDVIETILGNKEIVLFELKKEIGLALSGNCNVLEHINSTPILRTAEYLEMKRLINNAFGKRGLYNSYKGMATFNYKKFILQGRNTVKKYLYVFRGLMAGIYVLQTGIIQPNIAILNEYFKFPEIKKLIQLKMSGIEVEPVPEELDIGQLENRINYLFEKIDEAYIKSKIPEIPTEEDVNKIDEFLKSVRKDML